MKVLCCTKNINIKNNVKPQIAITTPDKLLTLFERAFFKFVVLFMSMEKTPNVNMVFECCFTGKILYDIYTLTVFILSNQKFIY